MCSIFGVLDIKSDQEELRFKALDMSKKIRHRGPDWSGVFSNEKAILVHERLAIVDLETGEQPLYSKNKKHVLIANGEIYNHKELAENLAGDYPFQTKSDCEIILALYDQKDNQFLDDLNGIFAFCLYDVEQDRYLIGRDHIGIIPLYMGWDEYGNFFIASEMKALIPICTKVKEFPKGHFLDSKNGEFTKYYSRDWMQYNNVKNNSGSAQDIKIALENAVKRQLMSDVSYGVLLSGGLDSSLIAAIAQRMNQSQLSTPRSVINSKRLHSFSVGLEGSPDIVAAQKVADYIGTVHHPIYFTPQIGIDAISDVIAHLETYDVTTIRAATPMYLMARKIKSMGIKMVLSGEGSDELFGGYLYFHKAPNAKEFHEELLRKVDRLHMYDCLRANKSMAAWGVETRVPFLDKEFVDVAMRVNPELKEIKGDRIEKNIVREAFIGYLPEDLIWRQKEQFSDGVGYSWINEIKKFVETRVSDQELANAKYRFPINTPDSKEAYFYRGIFQRHFPLDSAALCVPHGKSVACSTAQAIAWDEAFSKQPDPSGRAVNAHHYTNIKLQYDNEKTAASYS